MNEDDEALRSIVDRFVSDIQQYMRSQVESEAQRALIAFVGIVGILFESCIRAVMCK